MTNNIEDEIRALVANMENQDSQEKQTPPDEVHDMYVLIVRETEAGEEDQSQVVESAPITSQKISFMPAYVICFVYLFIIFSTIAFQIYCISNPPIAQVTIIPKSQTLTLSGTLQLGRLLQPITISQTQIVATTGHGHQDAKNATGTVTFFNGLFTQQFIASGTVYTGIDGVEIVTTQDATIPPGSPGSGYGIATVTAQAIETGSQGNISAGDIDVAVNNGLLVRNNQFHNGQYERTFNIVTQHDIHSVSTVLKTSLASSMQGALQGQLKPNEQLQLLPCNPTVTSDHQPGEEATTVNITVAETCSAIAYNSQELENKATVLLGSQAQSKLTGYSLFGDIQIKVIQASVTNAPHQPVFISFKATGTWIYGLSRQSQEHIKKLVAGKSKQSALHVLLTLPGVERVFISWGDDTKLPKNSNYIHIRLLVV